MIPYAKTKGSRFKCLGNPLKGERLRHFTTTRSERSVYRQPNKKFPRTRNRKYLKLLFDADAGYWRAAVAVFEGIARNITIKMPISIRGWCLSSLTA